MTEEHNSPIVIKKYANRRLYNTATSSYVTLEDLYKLVKEQVDFVVQDVTTGEDLTKLTLTQIIFEQEAKGYNLLPVSFLRQIISFYDDNLQNTLTAYLSHTMDLFTSNQDKYREFLDTSSLEKMNPLNMFNSMLEQNMKFYNDAFSFFNKEEKKTRK
jgi:polyhydroxyalkanoate synthesis repressor PhaR